MSMIQESSNRMKRVSVLIQRALADILKNKVKDPRANVWVSVSAVDVSKDLSSAKVFVTMLGTDEEHKEAVQALNKAAGYIRHELFQQLDLKSVPHLHFYQDDSLKHAQHLAHLIQEANKD